MRSALILFAFTLSLAAEGPPVETRTFRPADLVELTTLDSTIKLDVRYATANNFVGKPVYTQARAFLERPAAEALVRVHTALSKSGYGLVVFDGYRPWSVTKMFWDLTPQDKKVFVADPQKLAITFVLNGQTMQEATTSLMIHTVFEQVNYASNIMTLRNTLDFVREQEARERDDKILLHRPRPVHAEPIANADAQARKVVG